jgi:hypothetical protein
MSKIGRFFKAAFLTLMLVSIIAGLYFWVNRQALYIFLIAFGVGLVIWALLGLIAKSKGIIKVLSAIFRLEILKEEVKQKDLDLMQKGQFLLKIYEEPKTPSFYRIVTRTFSPIIMAFGILNTLIDSLGINMVAKNGELGLFMIETGFIFPLPTFEGFLLYVSAAIITCIFPFLWVIDDGDWMYFKKDSNESVKVSRIIMTYIRGYIGITMFLSGILLFVDYLIKYPGQWIEFSLMMLESFQIIAAVIFPLTILYFLVFHKFFVRKIRKNLWDILKLKCELRIKVAKVKPAEEEISLPEESELPEPVKDKESDESEEPS